MRDFLRIFESVFDSIQKEDGNEKKLYDLKRNYGGKIETTYEKLTRVTKTWTSEDGKYVSKSVTYVNGEPNTNEIKLQELLAMKDEALQKEDYEKCAALKKEIDDLKKSLN